MLTPGTRLGSYEILGPLGAGGMGEVYRAKDLRLGRDVALKVLPAEVNASPERLARFEREARAVAGLNHPNIVTLFTVEDQQGIRFLTMELVDGQTLDLSIIPGGLPIPRVIELGIALADALAGAHEKGVIHRDLKPANVMVTKDGRVKVLDFGLAKLAAPGSDLALTAAATMATPLSGEGQVVGTVPYMAPEQIRGEAVDARTDLFALGIILYELASGKRPFGGKTSADISSAILRDVPKPLPRVRSDLPADLERIVSRCLEKNPRERIQSALDVSNELRRLRRELERSESGLRPIPATDQVASIAVLPFANRSANAEDEYFSDGLADELLHVLAKIRGLRVAARASSFRFKGTTEDPAAIGTKLQVATLLDGSVRKAGNRVRISVQLVKAADGVQVWSEAYDRSLDDILAVQEEIAQAVVKELRSTLLGETADSDASGRARAEVAVAARGHGGNAEAHRLYLQGKHLLDRLTQEDTARGLEYLNQAVALDPTHAFAWLEISRAYGISVGYSWRPFHEASRQTRTAVHRALELAPDLAEAHARLANVQMYLDWDWKGAEKSLRRALDLAQNNDPALRSSGSLALALGDLAAAEAFFRRAIEQDPLNSFGYQSLGGVHLRAGRPDEAEEAYRKALELAPQRAVTHCSLSLTQLARGRLQEAMVEAMMEPEGLYRLLGLAIVYHALGQEAESNAALEQLTQRNAEDAACQIAQVCGMRGEVDRAFDWLERAYAQVDSGLAFVKGDPLLRSLHGDPRWGAFLKKMRLGD